MQTLVELYRQQGTARPHLGLLHFPVHLLHRLVMELPLSDLLKVESSRQRVLDRLRLDGRIVETLRHQMRALLHSGLHLLEQFRLQTTGRLRSGMCPLVLGCLQLPV